MPFTTPSDWKVEVQDDPDEAPALVALSVHFSGNGAFVGGTHYLDRDEAMQLSDQLLLAISEIGSTVAKARSGGTFWACSGHDRVNNC